MALPNRTLIDTLRETARRLEEGARYAWTHMGACNCGHLAQTITEFSAEEIHALALEKAGDWHQQVIDHCPTTGLPMDHLIDQLLNLGLSRSDLAHLERLSSPEVLRALPLEERHLSFKRRGDVIKYMRTMADVLEARLSQDAAQVAREGSVRTKETLAKV